MAQAMGWFGEAGELPAGAVLHDPGGAATAPAAPSISLGQALQRFEAIERTTRLQASAAGPTGKLLELPALDHPGGGYLTSGGK